MDGVSGEDRGLLGLAADREEWDPSLGGSGLDWRVEEWDPSLGGSGVADREEWDPSRGGSAFLDRDVFGPSRFFWLCLLWPESSSSESKDSLGMGPLVVRAVTMVLVALLRGVQKAGSCASLSLVGEESKEASLGRGPFGLRVRVLVGRRGVQNAEASLDRARRGIPRVVGADASVALAPNRHPGAGDEALRRVVREDLELDESSLRPLVDSSASCSGGVATLGLALR